jgi:hypothetical protein
MNPTDFNTDKQILILQIRKYIKNFCESEAIKPIIGSNSKELDKFIKSLVKKNITELQNIIIKI